MFSISLTQILQSPGMAISMMTCDFAFFSTKIKPDLLASITLSHWIFISQINFTLSYSTTGYLYPRLILHHHLPQLLQVNAHTTSLFFQGYASCTISNRPILELYHVFSYTHAALVFTFTYYMLHSFSPFNTHSTQRFFQCLVSFIICIICP